MAAGEIGTDYAADAATYVAYSPIPRSIQPTENRSGASAYPCLRRKLPSLPTASSEEWFLCSNCWRRLRRHDHPGHRRGHPDVQGITGPIVALGAGVTRIGSGDLGYRMDVKTGDEIEVLANAFNKMADDVQTYIKNLQVTTAEKERFASELRVAHDIQMSFLKKIFPAFPHRNDFSLYARIETAREVGGDLYDFVLVDATRLFFYVVTSRIRACRPRWSWR